MPMVFVVQESKKMNYEPARDYGRVRAIISPDEQVILTADDTVRRIRAGLEDFVGGHDDDADFLILTGDPIAICIACTIVCDVSNGKFKVLKWDRMLNNNKGGYWVVEMNLQKGEKDGDRP